MRAAVERARPAAQWWAELGFAGRKTRLRAWRAILATRIDELADLIHRENGKPELDAVGEIALAVEHLDWAAGAAKKVLGRRRVRLRAARRSTSPRTWSTARTAWSA